MADISKLKPNGATGTEYNIIDDDYRNTDHTFTMNTYSSYSHTFEDTQISQRMPVRNVFTAIQSLFNSVKTAINDHGSLFGDIATALAFRVTKDNATYKALNFHSYDHTIDDSMELTTQFDGAGETGCVWFTNTNLGVVTDAINDHAEWIAKETAGAKTVTGNPLIITDASPNKAEKIEIVFDPKQDKHGYNSVWVGGAGKNKLMSPVKSITSRQVTFTCDGNGKITADGTASGTPDQCYIDVQTEFGALKKGGTYKIVSNGDIYFNILVQVNGSYTKIVNASKSATFTIDANATQILIRAVPYFNGYEYNNAVSYPVIVESTETDTSFSSYENISPITGYTSLSADGCGINLANPVLQGYYDTTGFVSNAQWTACELVECNQNTKYTLSNDTTLGGNVFFYDENMSYLSYVATGYSPNTITTPNNAKYMGVYGRGFSHCQLEVGEQATHYKPYNGSNVTVQFDQTLYGGKLTIFQDGSADVYCDTGFGEFDGSEDENWTLVDNNSIKTDYIFPAMKTATSTWIYAFSSDFSAGADGVAPSTWLTTYATNNPTALEFRNIVSNWGISAYTVDAWKSYLTSRSIPLQVVYELKDPFTIHLSPVETLTLLQGINNVWTDGTTLSLTYQPDNAIGQAKGDVQELRDDVDDRLVGNACKNLFRTTLTTQTKDGVTYTKNNNGTVSVSGTPTSYANVTLGEAEINSDMGIITFSGFSGSKNITINRFDVYDSNDVILYTAENVTEVTIDLSNYPTAARILVTIKRLNNGVACSGVVMPQLEISPSPTAYEEYYPSNRELWEMIKALQS